MRNTIRLLVPLLVLIFGANSHLRAQDVDSGSESGSDSATTTAAAPADASMVESDAAGGEEEAVSSYDKADVAWMLVSIALVLMMTCPGLALFYGGLVRKKNILSVMMQCVFLMGMMSVVWAVIGYSLAFGGKSPYVGNLDHVMLKGVAPAMTVPSDLVPSEVEVGQVEELASTQIFVAFQGMFFIITPALICGAFAERMKFSAMCAFCLLWGLLIYCPIAHWVWADSGWLCEWNEDAKFHAIDFAGGLVVHISSGVSALVCAVVIGTRRGFPTTPMPPHNLTYTCIGTGLLWVGWFGFNGGSELGADGRAVNAVFATHLAAAAGVLGWSLAEFIKHGKASILGACSGAVAGLVCITPASGSVAPISAIAMGFLGGGFCYLCCTKLKNSLGYDDSLDAFGVHGMGGTLGALLTGVFATRTVTGSEGAHGLLDGNGSQMIPQVVSVLVAVVFSGVGTFVLCKILDGVMGLRVSDEQEIQGLDVSQHGEEGYIFQ